MIGKVWTRRSYLLPVINMPSIIATAIVAIAVATNDRRYNISYPIVNIIHEFTHQDLYYYSSEASLKYWKLYSIIKDIVSSAMKTTDTPVCNHIFVMVRGDLPDRFHLNDLVFPFVMLQKTPECRQIMYPGTQFKAINAAL